MYLIASNGCGIFYIIPLVAVLTIATECYIWLDLSFDDNIQHRSIDKI